MAPPVAHRPSRRDEQRSRHNPDGCPIHRAVMAIAEVIELLKVELDPHAAMPGIFHQLREIAGHRCDEAIQFAERLLLSPLADSALAWRGR
jgi:hypothetical protein